MSSNHDDRRRDRCVVGQLDRSEVSLRILPQLAFFLQPSRECFCDNTHCFIADVVLVVMVARRYALLVLGSMHACCEKKCGERAGTLSGSRAEFDDYASRFFSLRFPS